MDSKLVLLPVSMEEFIQSIQEVIRLEVKKLNDETQEAKLLSPIETCNLFQPNISKVTLSKWTNEGHLKSYRIGGRVYYKLSEVLASLSTLKRYMRTVA